MSHTALRILKPCGQNNTVIIDWRSERL